MDVKSRLSLWRYPAYWPIRSIALALFPAIAGFFILDSYFTSSSARIIQYKDSLQSQAETILAVKLSAVQDFIWQEQLSCELNYQTDCNPAQISFSESPKTGSSISILVKKECKICHSSAPAYVTFQFKGAQNLIKHSSITQYSAKTAVIALPLLVLISLIFFSRKTDLVYACILHERISTKKEYAKRRKSITKLARPIYMEEHEKYARFAWPGNVFQKALDKGVLKEWTNGAFNGLENARFVFINELPNKGYPISAEALKNVGALSVQAKPGQIFIEQAMASEVDIQGMDLQTREALWKGKSGKDKRFLVYPMAAVKKEDKNKQLEE